MDIRLPRTMRLKIESGLGYKAEALLTTRDRNTWQVTVTQTSERHTILRMFLHTFSSCLKHTVFQVYLDKRHRKCWWSELTGKQCVWQVVIAIKESVPPPGPEFILFAPNHLSALQSYGVCWGGLNTREQVVSQGSHLGNELELLPKAKPKDPSSCYSLEVDSNMRVCACVCVLRGKLKCLSNNQHIHTCFLFFFFFSFCKLQEFLGSLDYFMG